MKASKKSLVLACLLSTTGMSATQHNRSVEVIQRAYSLDPAAARLQEVLETILTTVKIAISFEAKYACKAQVRCTTCQQEAVYKLVLDNIALEALDDMAVNQNKINAAKSLMVQALDIFSHRELDEILEFMARAANELEMPCREPNCPGRHWEIVRAN